MFGLFSKKKEKSVKDDPKIKIYSEEEQGAIRQSIDQLTAQIEAEEQREMLREDALAGLKEQVGLAYEQLGQTDQAIVLLEQSLSLKPSIGEGYKKLMHLYNSKRAEAAKNRDDEGIEHYMNKLDDMRQLAKKMTVSRK